MSTDIVGLVPREWLLAVYNEKSQLFPYSPSPLDSSPTHIECVGLEASRFSSSSVSIKCHGLLNDL